MQSIFFSPTGMWEARNIWLARCWWHRAHVAGTVSLRRFALSETECITVWHPVQATSRVSCTLPDHITRAVFSWQLRQAASLAFTLVFDFALKVMSCPSSSPPELAC